MIKPSSQKILAACLLVLTLAMATQVYMHFAPGALSPDSLIILAQARSGVFEDGHPPLMAAIWRVIDRTVPGPSGMLLLNLALFYGGLYLIFLWGIPRYNIGVLPASLVVGIFPPIIGILGVIWIDVTMAGFFLVAVGVSLAGHASPEKRLRISALLVALLFATLGTAVRHNAAAGAFPLISLLLFQNVSDRAKLPLRLALTFFSGLLITLALFLGTRQISGQYVGTKRHLWRLAALYDIAGASYHEKENLFYSDIMGSGSLGDVYKLYSPRSLTPLVVGQQIHALPGMPIEKGNAFELNLSNPNLDRRLLENWIQVIVHHPRAYLKHRYDVFTSLVTRSAWGLWVPVFDSVYPNDLGIAERPIRDSHYFAYVKELAKSNIVFVPLLYLTLTTLMVVPTLVCGLHFQSEALLAASALYGSGVTHMIGLFFLVASSDFRYSHWMITATVLATSIVALEVMRAVKMSLRADRIHEG